jgi:hypothetical protein
MIYLGLQCFSELELWTWSYIFLLPFYVCSICWELNLFIFIYRSVHTVFIRHFSILQHAYLKKNMNWICYVVCWLDCTVLYLGTPSLLCFCQNWTECQGSCLNLGWSAWKWTESLIGQLLKIWRLYSRDTARLEMSTYPRCVLSTGKWTVLSVLEIRIRSDPDTFESGPFARSGQYFRIRPPLKCHVPIRKK